MASAAVGSRTPAPGEALGDRRLLPPEAWAALYARFPAGGGPDRARSGSRASQGKEGSDEQPLDVAKSDGVLRRPSQLLPGVIAHTVGNLLGGASFGAGWALGKADAKLGGAAMASDSGAFKAGFRTWLYANGVLPTVLCESGPYGNDLGPLPQDRGARQRMLRDTALIVSNHVSYLDTVVLPLVLDVPKLMAMKEVASWPLIGQVCQEMDMIWVDRTDPNSRKAAKQAIKDHVAAWQQGDKPLLMWPEGTTSNGHSMKEFKSGAFEAGVPVRPVLIKYTGDWDPANVMFRESTGDEQTSASAGADGKVGYGDTEWAQQFLGHIIHSCTVLVCRRYMPNKEEKADPELYKENVRKLMLLRLKELHELEDRKRREQEERRSPLNVDLNAAVDGVVKGVDRLFDFAGRGLREAAARLREQTASAASAASARPAREPRETPCTTTI